MLPEQEEIPQQIRKFWSAISRPWSRIADIAAISLGAITIYAHFQQIDDYIRSVTAPTIHQYTFSFRTFLEKSDLPGDNWLSGFIATRGISPALLTLESIDEPNNGPHADEILVVNKIMNNVDGILVSIGFAGGIDRMRGSVTFNIYQPDAKEWPAPTPCPFGQSAQQC